jgi:hypothetical protein
MVNKVVLPKIKIKKLDISKINLRKINLVTVMGILSYVHILVLIPLFFARKSPFVQFHVRQGIALLFVWVLFSFSFYVLFLPWIFALLILFLMFCGIVNVITGKERILPIVGGLTKIL